MSKIHKHLTLFSIFNYFTPLAFPRQGGGILYLFPYRKENLAYRKESKSDREEIETSQQEI